MERCIATGRNHKNDELGPSLTVWLDHTSSRGELQ